MIAKCALCRDLSVIGWLSAGPVSPVKSPFENKAATVQALCQQYDGDNGPYRLFFYCTLASEPGGGVVGQLLVRSPGADPGRANAGQEQGACWELNVDS